MRVEEHAQVTVYRVVTLDDDLVPALCLSGTGMIPIKKKKAVGPPETKVEVEVSEKLAHPTAYSSISVSVRVALNCGHSDTHIRQAAQHAYELAQEQVEEHIGSAYAALERHLEEINQ